MLSKLVGGATRQRDDEPDGTAARAAVGEAQQLLHGDDALQSTAHSRLV